MDEDFFKPQMSKAKMKAFMLWCWFAKPEEGILIMEDITKKETGNDQKFKARI